MRLFAKAKDGGPYSKVTAYFLIEWKRFFSIALLRFDQGSRDVFHTHAFHCISWVLAGTLLERLLNGEWKVYPAGWRPVITRRTTFHQVYGGTKRSWALTIRGPWSKTWKEYIPAEKRTVTLTNGRKEV